METTTCKYGFEAEQPKNNYKAEGDEFSKNLKNSLAYCRQFFFDTEVTDEKGKKKKKPCQIAPMRSKMIYDFKRDYDVDVKPEDFSTILYTVLWGDGTWSALDSFEGRCSFFAWLKKVAKNAIMDWLIEERMVEDVRCRTVGNTRLALLSQSPSKCKTVLDELLVGSKYYGLLSSIYVERLSAEKVMQCMHMNEVEYEAAKKAAENKLKDALLRSVEFSEENILRDKKKHVVTVSTEFGADLSEWVKSKTGVNPLSEVFGTNLTDEEIRLKTVDFLYDFSAKLWPEKVGEDIVVNEDDDEDTKKEKEKLLKKKEEKEQTNKRDCYIWRRRFIQNVASEDVAMEVDRDRGWLDTRYSRLNAKFKKAIKEWWKSHAL